MYKLAVSFLAAALVASPAVLAQDDCITNCLANSIGNTTCTDPTATACLCTDTAYTTAVGACIVADCPDQAEAAAQLQAETCAAAETGTDTETGAETGTGSASTSRTPTTGAATTRPTTSATHSSASSSSSSSSSSTGAGFHTASIASGVTLALFGAAISLF